VVPIGLRLRYSASGRQPTVGRQTAGSPQLDSLR
jgi:hypothetical protein